MSDAIQRVRPEIQLTSPEGNIFTAKWQKNRKPTNKKLGIFNYPKLNGSIVQDLGIDSRQYPMTLFFDGPDHDIESQRFETAFSETGTWEVIHPVDGNLTLQPTSINLNVDSIETASYTAIETNWIEPLEQEALISLTEQEAKIKRQKIDVNIEGSAQFESATQDSAAEKIAISNTTDKSVTAFDQNMKSVYSQSPDATARVTGVKSSINETVGEPTINLISLAGQVQALCQTPGLVVTDTKSKIKFYEGMITNILAIDEDGGTNPEDKNTALTQELFLTATLGAMADTVTVSDYDTRAEVIEIIESVTDLFNQVIDGLDALMDNFSAKDFDLQYFSLSESWNKSLSLLAQIIAYLLRVSFNLKVEKTIKLAEDKPPIRVVIEEYGELGEDDFLLDWFIASNNLIGNEIICIPQGREVKVYV